MLAVLKVTIFLGNEVETVKVRLICPNCPKSKASAFLRKR